MGDSDCIEWLERLYDTKRRSIFLYDAEPRRTIGGIRWLEYASVDLAL